MEIVIRDKKLKRALENTKECRKRFGDANAKKIRLRMDALAAAESLADFWPPNSTAERCHELKGDKAGIFSMNVMQPLRLLFKEYVSDEERQQQQQESGNQQSGDERQRWSRIKSVEVIGVEDTHG
jgi:proteic killer suppression protein